MLDPSCTSSDGPKCPYCGHTHSEAEDWEGHVSYWGSESGSRTFYCHDCELEFEVDEVVTRHWESQAVIQPSTETSKSMTATAEEGAATSRASHPLKWHGGKSYLAKWIHSLAPPSAIDDPDRGYTHRNIAFAGGLGEFWGWQPVEGIAESVNDLNGDIGNFYQVLQSATEFAEFQRRICLGPFSRRGFEQASAGHAADGVSRAVDFFVRFRQSRQGLGVDFATPSSRLRRGMPESVSAYLSAVEGLPEAHARLRRVVIESLPATAFIKRYDHKRAIHYCDPPYLASTRSGGGEYGEHELSEAGHAQLLNTLARIKGRFLLSGYRSSLYDCAARCFGWSRHDREIDNKAASGKTKPKRIECVWTNY